jgi:hypothetical protein
MRDRIGIDSICWELDYPHSDSSWPDAPEQLAAQLDGCNFDEVEAICWKNASRLYQYDGVERLGREACTVAALRAQSSDVDLAVPKVAAGRAPKPGLHPLTFREMRKRMASVLAGGK